MVMNKTVVEAAYQDRMRAAWAIVRSKNEARIGRSRAKTLRRFFVWANPTQEERFLEGLQGMSAQVSHNLHRLIVTQNDPLVRQGVSIS
ncbi:MAG: hypothetical protein HRT94_01225 [Alphaproteobacteria bacterium]|nr:hypothetical protein [Alphaproteobacteria bacterium]